MFFSFLFVVVVVELGLNAPPKKHQTYLDCLKDSKDMHHKCKELSRDYLQCRMDHQLMSQENLESVSLTHDVSG